MNKVKLSRDTLSAMVDAQSSEFETRQILQQLAKNPDLLETWKRYHAVRAILQSSPRDFSKTDSKLDSFSDFSDNFDHVNPNYANSNHVKSAHHYLHLDISAVVSEKLRDEPPLMCHKAERLGGARLPLSLPWMKSFAVAASVAFVALFGVKFTADSEWSTSQDILASVDGDVNKIQPNSLQSLRQQGDLNIAPFVVENNAVLASQGSFSETVGTGAEIAGIGSAGVVSKGTRQLFKPAHQDVPIGFSNKKIRSNNSQEEVSLSPLELYLMHKRQAAAVSAAGLMPMTRALTVDKTPFSTYQVEIRQTATRQKQTTGHQTNEEGVTFDGKLHEK